MIQAKEQKTLNKLNVLYGDHDFLVCHENDIEVRLSFPSIKIIELLNMK